MDTLVWCKRNLQPIVNSLGLRRIVSPLYRKMVSWRYRDDGLATATQNGRTWKLHHEVALRGEYAEFDTVLWLREVIKPGDCVIDVGANVGQMTLEMAELVGPTGKVIAIEPAPGNVALLKRHVEANGFNDRVEIIQAACGSECGSILLNINGDSPDTVGSGHNIMKAGNLSIPVPMVSLDAVCEEKQLNPAAVKVDVEGAELEVVKGGVNVLRCYRPELLVGFHPFAFPDVMSATKELRENMKSHGYDCPPPNAQGEYELAEYRMRPNGK